MKASKIIIIVCCLIFLCVCLFGVISDVIDVDAAQYASISMEMLQNDNYLHVTERGNDYLDKPPFLFWISALSFKIFGLSNFAYKFPSLLFSLLGLLYTYKLGKYLFTHKTGLYASAILGTSLGFFWINNDVKTDAIVTSCVLFSTYYLLLFINEKKLVSIILAAIGIGIGMLTKGPLALIFPLSFVFFYTIIHKKYKAVLTPRWLLLPIVAGLILLPMLIGLYEHFDVKSNISGLRFFFWEQSFGRITGENSWKNDTSFFFLFHSLILLIFPFSVLTIIAFYKKIHAFIVKKEKDGFFLIAGTITILCALSLSAYKIPQYAMVVFPFVALIIADYLSSLENSCPTWLALHNIVLGFILFAAGALSFLAFDFSYFVLLAYVFLLVLFVITQLKKKIIEPLIIIGLALGLIMNSHIIPSFEKYSQGRQFSELIKANQIDKETIYFFNRESRAIEFYLGKRIQVVEWFPMLEKQKNKESAWYYMSKDGKEALLNAGLKPEKEYCLYQYDVNRLKLGFFVPSKRQKYLEPRYLIKFKCE